MEKARFISLAFFIFAHLANAQTTLFSGTLHIQLATSQRFYYRLDIVEKPNSDKNHLLNTVTFSQGKHSAFAFQLAIPLERINRQSKFALHVTLAHDAKGQQQIGQYFFPINLVTPDPAAMNFVINLAADPIEAKFEN